MAQGTSFEGFGFGLHQGDSRRSQLIVAAQRGDAAAFQELVLSYDATVMRVALALTGSEGLAQQIYIRVFRDAFASINTLNSSSSIFVWLHRILVEHCLEYCKGNQSCLARSGLQNFAEILRGLPPTERVVFLLKHSQRLKLRTIAKIFACPPERIANVLQSATISLRAQLKSQLGQIA